ncbi:DUF309 domain-containing protein [Paenibacillus oenotherae]|uniref:DUF309 domain-containing protein n=1 Tax=Paenibacillus oenotherae TaxID=1435645 RepID=A0ABS7DCP3_9BACL|nr:DUF309 domain-containing protein [Paenibacillus oenotherae]MBW7477709.1 DUF309 domain-containing protein [Paenibacillus oenotherae]
MTAETSYDDRFVHFVVLFNVDEDYYECHEVMEELWLEEGRNLLYQGLLQAAVGLHHWRNDNYSGAVKLFSQAENKLAHYPERAMGLDLANLRTHTAGALVLLREWVERDGIHEGGTGIHEDEAGVHESGAKASTDKAPEQVPPPFQPFPLAVVDEKLERLVQEMALIPFDQRLHGED